ACYALDRNPPARKSITVSRTFGESVTELSGLEQAVAMYASRAAEKLREEKRAAGLLTVYISTSRHISSPLIASAAAEFEEKTSDSMLIVKQALKLLAGIYRKGYRYKKAGVLLNNLCPETRVQRSLFSQTDHAPSKRLMSAIDKINSSTGAGVFWAAEGIQRPWRTQANHLSRRYTTSFSELPEVK
ncbi:MAG: DUF4113 domain-containing protein, partial [Phycisphaerae bacterium]